MRTGRLMGILDGDGVLVDHESAWIDLYRRGSRSHQHAPLRHEDNTYWRYPPDLCPTCYRACLDSNEMILTADPVSGAVEGAQALDELADLFIVTHIKPEQIPLRTLWMYKHDIPHWGVVHSGEKEREVELFNASFIVDDGVHNLERVQDPYCLRVVFDQPWNRSYDAEGNGMVRAKGWPHLVEILSAHLKGGPPWPRRKLAWAPPSS